MMASSPTVKEELTVGGVGTSSSEHVRPEYVRLQGLLRVLEEAAPRLLEPSQANDLQAADVASAYRIDRCTCH